MDLAGHVDGHRQDANAAAAQLEILEAARAVAMLLQPQLADTVQRALRRALPAAVASVGVAAYASCEGRHLSGTLTSVIFLQ